MKLDDKQQKLLEELINEVKEIKKQYKEDLKIKKEYNKVINKYMGKFIKSHLKLCNYTLLVSIVNAFYNNEEIIKEILSWNVISTSPYSSSYYNAKNITWNSKPEGSLRLSDHWNFESQGTKHCQLENTDEYTEKLMLCEYHNGKYRIIKEY